MGLPHLSSGPTFSATPNSQIQLPTFFPTWLSNKHLRHLGQHGTFHFCLSPRPSNSSLHQALCTGLELSVPGIHMVYLPWSSFRIFSSTIQSRRSLRARGLPRPPCLKRRPSLLARAHSFLPFSWNFAVPVIKFCVCLLAFSLSSCTGRPREQDHFLKNLVHYCPHNVFDWQAKCSIYEHIN